MQVARGYGEELHEVEWDGATKIARRKKKNHLKALEPAKREKRWQLCLCILGENKHLLIIYKLYNKMLMF